MASVFGGPIHALSDREVARLRRLAANRPRGRLAAPDERDGDCPWLRHPDCAVADRLRAEE